MLPSRDQTMAPVLRFPRPLYDLVFGREWYVEPAAPGPIRRDIFSGLP